MTEHDNFREDVSLSSTEESQIDAAEGEQPASEFLKALGASVAIPVSGPVEAYRVYQERQAQIRTQDNLE